MKFVEVIRFGGVNESRRLLHVDFFGQGTMEEGIVDIHLFDVPIKMHCNRKNKSYGYWFGYWARSFMII